MNELFNIFLQAILFIYNTIAFNNLGLAIIEIGILSRLVFWPMLKQQAHQGKKMREIQPLLNTLKVKHKDNKQAMAAAQMELFKQHGVNPAAGCLPQIVQLVVLIGLYNAIDQALKLNLNTQFLFWNMDKPDVWHLSGINFAIPGILVALASLTQFIQTKMMMGTPPAIRKEDKPSEKEEKADFMTEFASAQSSMIWLFPLMFLYLGTQFSSGLALYWVVSSVVMIFQQYKAAGLGGLEQYVVKYKQLAARG